MSGRLYFAYGSNLVVGRLRERVGVVEVLAAARAREWRLECNKLGRDGSGKANLVASRGDAVWGVVYALAPDGLAALDSFEGGYRRLEIEVDAADGDTRVVQTYVSERLAPEPVPFAWYKDLMLEGARSHGLPAEWLARLAALPSRPDPRRAGLGA